jgi:chromosomal replication initiation ATPase DnaA
MLEVSRTSALKTRQRSPAFSDVANQQQHRQARLALDLAMTSVFGIESGALWHGTRGAKETAFARQIAMYLAHVSCGMTLTDVGVMFGRDRTTVSYGCLKVEYRRDDPVLDRTLDLLGWALPTLVMRAEKRRPH